MANSKNDNRGGGIMPPPKTSTPIQGYYMPNIPTVGGYSKEDDGMFHPKSTDAHVPVFHTDTPVIFHPKTDDTVFAPKPVVNPISPRPKSPNVDTGGGIIPPRVNPIVVVDPIIDNKDAEKPIAPPAPLPSIDGGTPTQNSGETPIVSDIPLSKKDYSWLALVAAAGIFGVMIFKK